MSDLLSQGLINNVLYVIILSAALDLVGPHVPKSAVLLFDVIPSFLVKLTAPYYIHNVSYSLRILVFVALSTCGMLLIALTPSSVANGHETVPPPTSEILVKMSGVVLASLSSGGGELSFLGLTHYYGSFSLAAWGSGTGGAGIVGGGAYVLATTAIGLSVRTSLLAFSFLPIVMLVAFFVILPRGPMSHGSMKKNGYQALPEPDDQDPADDANNEDPLGVPSHLDPSSTSAVNSVSQRQPGPWLVFRGNVIRAKALFFP